MNDGIFKEESWAKLERPERLKNLNPEETLTVLGVKAGDRFADFGSGTGVFIVPALEIVGSQGKVYAVERSQALIDRMLARFTAVPETLTVVKEDLMALYWAEAPLQTALLCHVAHELPDLAHFLRLAAQAMASGGHIGIIEWSVKEQPQGPPLHKRIAPEALADTLGSTGWIPEPPRPLGEDFYLIIAVKA